MPQIKREDMLTAQELNQPKNIAVVGIAGVGELCLCLYGKRRIKISTANRESCVVLMGSVL